MATSIVQHCTCAHCGGAFSKPVTNPPTNTKYCSLACRFWNKVDRSGGADACWPWIAKAVKTARCGLQYGDFRVSGGSSGSHRVAWELTNGPIPDGLCVCHRCDNPLCCNPAHFFLGTRLDNVEDMISKGRRGEMSADGKERLRASKIGKKRPPHVGERVRQAHLGRKQSEEEIRKRAAANTGKKRSEEVKQKMRDAWVLRRAKA